MKQDDIKVGQTYRNRGQVRTVLCIARATPPRVLYSQGSLSRNGYFERWLSLEDFAQWAGDMEEQREMSTPKLLPCPFCGAEPAMTTSGDESDESWCVICPNCEATFDFPGEEEVDAAWRWNRRAGEAAKTK